MVIVYTLVGLVDPIFRPGPGESHTHLPGQRFIIIIIIIIIITVLRIIIIINFEASFGF